MLRKKNTVFAILILILFLSGSYSLIYQIAWVRILTLLLGSTTMGITTVVATFMCGLALGSWLSARFLISKDKPLRTYAVLELLISFTAFLSPFLFSWSYTLVPAVLQSIGGSNAAVFVLRILYSSVFMLIPTICMGAALPVLGKYLENYSSLAERRISVLYGFNTIGACFGCIASGYFLLPSIGLKNTLYFTSAANALLPVFIYFLMKLNINEKPSVSMPKQKKQKAKRLEVVQNDVLLPHSRYVILGLATLIGFMGLSSELIWTRIIVMTVGGSVYAYSTILSVYLFFYGTGLAVGGFSLRIISKKAGAGTLRISKWIFFSLIILIAVSASVSIPVAGYLPDYFMRNFSIERSFSAYGLFHHQLIPSIMLMAPPSLFLGMIFPFELFLLKNCSSGAAVNTSKLYAMDTLGSVTGTIAAAFILIPHIGIDNSLRVTGTIIILSGLAASYLLKVKKIAVFQSAGIIGIMIIWLVIPEMNKVSLSAGIGVYAPAYQSITGSTVSETFHRFEELIYYRDGFTSTITVARDKSSNTLTIKTNGKTDGSTGFDMATQKLSAHMPAVFHPDPKKTCVIGFGTGTTAGSLALHPDIKVDVVEIEPAMVEGAMLLNDYNNDPMGKDNVELHLTDGRLFLLTADEKYDIIISEPSNPWLAGVSDLYTLDFYKLGRDALAENGVFCQWIQIYSLDSESLKILFRTFTEVFPNSYLAAPLPSDMLLVGTTGDYRPSYDDLLRRLSHPEIIADLTDPMVNINSVEEFISRLILGPEQIRKIAGTGPINKDNLPILTYRAPLSLFNYSTVEQNMNMLMSYRVFPSELLGWKSDMEE